MAKRRFLPVARTRTRVVTVARRAGRAAVGAASNQKHTIAAVGAAAILGWLEQRQAEKPGSEKLPQIEALGPAATYGIAAWAVGKFTKNRIAEHLATGLLSVAAYQWAVAPPKDKDATEGEVSGDDFVGEEE